MAAPINLEAGTWATEVEQSSLPVLVDFWHDTCVWCKRLDPFFNELTAEFTGKVKFAKLNILSTEANFQVAERFGVMSTPTLTLFCQGRPVQALVGYRPKEALRREIQQMMETYQDCFKQQTPVERGW